MTKRRIRRIGILTGGGDCPGLNAVIRAVAKTALNDHDIEVVGIYDSYWGLVMEHFQPLSNRDVSGILAAGGTILGTSRVNPFQEAYDLGRIKSPEEDWGYVKKILRKHKIDALVAVGGDGTLRVAQRAFEAGIPVVGVPKTIDNDINATDLTFGFDSAVAIISSALDVLHTTAMSHHRVMVVEVMGRHAGWLALHGGVAGGGDILLLPEIPFDEKHIFEEVERRNSVGKRFSIVVVAEGARPAKGTNFFSGDRDKSGREILGGIGRHVRDRIQDETGISSRVTVLGHLQRGGSPTSFDRLLATRFGHQAMGLVARGEFGQMIAWRGGKMKAVSLERATGRQKKVPANHPLVQAARSVGTSFGDA